MKQTDRLANLTLLCDSCGHSSICKYRDDMIRIRETIIDLTTEHEENEAVTLPNPDNTPVVTEYNTTTISPQIELADGITLSLNCKRYNVYSSIQSISYTSPFR